MLRQSIFTLFALLALNVSANPDLEKNPIADFVNNEIEYLELELELFGTPTNDDIITVASIEVYEIEEEVILTFDTQNYLPEDFNAKKGMSYINWDSFNLIEVEEEEVFDFDVKQYLPKNFDPFKGMLVKKTQGICYN